ncbi:alpha/beta fold hydrolase [Streptomyces sp. NPDC023998]|uniref:thioesterase II family protein n=1 Tax=Streptomyces sp. NPDC023998 TaxID=3154597 RepID=UPI00340D1927
MDVQETSLAATGAEDWFPFPRMGTGTGLSLVCLPFAGGGASRFLPLGRRLAPLIEVQPVQFPGRESRIDDPPCPDAGRLVAELSSALAPGLDGPYALLGYSLGAAYAFELALSLRARGLPEPRALFVLAAVAPHTRSPERLSEASEEDLVERILRAEGVPPEVLTDRELLAMALGTLRMDLGMWERFDHKAESRLECPIYVYAGSADMSVSSSQLAGWRQRTTGRCRFRTFSGGHFFGFDNTSALAAAIGADLAHSS